VAPMISITMVAQLQLNLFPVEQSLTITCMLSQTFCTLSVLTSQPVEALLPMRLGTGWDFSTLSRADVQDPAIALRTVR
jgi:hypothetical protein